MLYAHFTDKRMITINHCFGAVFGAIKAAFLRVVWLLCQSYSLPPSNWKPNYVQEQLLISPTFVYAPPHLTVITPPTELQIAHHFT